MHYDVGICSGGDESFFSMAGDESVDSYIIMQAKRVDLDVRSEFKGFHNISICSSSVSEELSSIKYSLARAPLAENLFLGSSSSSDSKNLMVFWVS